MPDSPNLLFTNAGMNQFVPIFLGQRPCPYAPARAADTQKCIRAGGKHNDLDDVGLDTYHHTFFEMLGNWSFGDYFKKEAIDCAWELVTGVWKFPKERLYATVYRPDKSKGDPSEFDQTAYDCWAVKFIEAGLDPKVHIVNGNKKDNFWMMGETGPCGPCSELHCDLTPAGNTKGAMVNRGSAQCIEIWNLVFMQFNANPDGTFSPLPAQNVDTGMGFERVSSIMQCTKNFTDFSGIISNYETDIFRPIFSQLEKMSGKRYGSTLPKPGALASTEQEIADIAFRVIADHIRTLSFAIADGIVPSNTDRNYVLRRILRRAVRYGRSLGFHEPFFYRLVDVVAEHMGDVFPELRARKEFVQNTIRQEEEAFNRTLDRGMDRFDEMLAKQASQADAMARSAGAAESETPKMFASDDAFELYDTYGFPLDLTELIARERGLGVDVAGFNKRMEEQRERARAAQKREIISVTNIDTAVPTRFIGYEALQTPAKVLEVVRVKDKTAVVLDVSACYAEMGGQVGDSGELVHGGQLWRVANTQRVGNTFLHILEDADSPCVGMELQLMVDALRRAAIQRHHTVSHLLHWALHEVVGREATQKGSSVAPDKMTFDFNAAPLTQAQTRDIEKLVNERIVENGSVSWSEVPFAEIKNHPGIMQLFGEKYGDHVRVIQIGGQPGALNGYSMELCGGTHTRATGEIGLFRIVSEGAIAAGTRRIEALAGMCAYEKARKETDLLLSVSGMANTPVAELEKKMESLLATQKELEKQIKAAHLKQAAEMARELASTADSIGACRFIVENLGEIDAELPHLLIECLKGQFKGVVVLGGTVAGSVQLAASVSPEHVKQVQAGKIIQTIAPMVGGKGGGKPDYARGGGKDPSQLDQALAHAKTLIAG